MLRPGKPVCGIGSSSPISRSRRSNEKRNHWNINAADVEYRGFEYTVVQGIERGVWKWSASVEGVIVMSYFPEDPAAIDGGPELLIEKLKVLLCTIKEMTVLPA